MALIELFESFGVSRSGIPPKYCNSNGENDGHPNHSFFFWAPEFQSHLIMLFSLVEDTCLIQGIVVDKDFSHPQMPKSVKEMGMGMIWNTLFPLKWL